jgi:hypothetical protein
MKLKEIGMISQFLLAFSIVRVYTPCLYVLNKIDQITIEELDILNKMPDVVPVSGFHKWNLDELLEKIWDKLDLIRMYASWIVLS